MEKIMRGKKFDREVNTILRETEIQLTKQIQNLKNDNKYNLNK